MADLVEIGYLDAPETPAEMGHESCAIIAILGRAFDAGAVALVEWGPDPENVDESFSEVVAELDGLGRGDQIRLPIDGLTPATPFFFRLRIAGETGEIRESCTDPDPESQDPDDEIHLIETTDGHNLEAVNEGATNRVVVIERTYANAADQAGRIRGPLRVIDFGDTTPYARKNNLLGPMYPINEDGSPNGTATSEKALSQQECEYDCRIVSRQLGPLRPRAPLIKCAGNHEAEHWMFAAANNGGATDVAAWSRAAYNKVYGNMGDQPNWHGDPNGTYGWIDLPPVRLIFINCYRGSRVATPTNFPDGLDSSDDWALDQDEYDELFDPTTGAAYTANPAVTPFVQVCMHQVMGGTGTQIPHYGRGGKKYVVRKAANANSREHGADPSWGNPRNWTGAHLARGIHKAVVEAAIATGCIFVVKKGHDHCHLEEWVDGVLYLTLAQPSSINDSPFSTGFHVDGEYAILGAGLTPTDPDRNNIFLRNPGYYLSTVNRRLLAIDYRKTFVPGLVISGVTGNGNPVSTVDDIRSNHTSIRRIQLARPTTPLSRFRDSFNRTVEDSTAMVTAGSAQPTRTLGEPKHCTTEFGAYWNAWSSGSGDDEVYLAVRTSIIDGAKVLSSRRPVTAGGAAVRQTISRPLYGLSRDIRVKCRVSTAGLTLPFAVHYIGICVQAINLTTAAAGKGLYLQVRGATGPGATKTTLFWDDGAANTSLASASPNYGMPENAAFDAGLIIRLRRRRVQVFAPVSSVMTKIIDHTLSDPIMADLIANRDYWNCGVSAETNNITNQGHVFEWRDFEAKSIVPGG